MILAVEGLDGAGKSTIALGLAHALDATYVTLPPPSLRLVGAEILQTPTSMARYLYYLASVAAISEFARPLGLVIADRFIASAHALHLQVQGNLAISLRGLEFPRADLTIYLHVQEDERRARLARRQAPLDPFEEMLNRDQGFREDVVRRLRCYPDTYIVNTTNRRPFAIIEEAANIWRTANDGQHDAEEASHGPV
jgi:thymidylate kinase